MICKICQAYMLIKPQLGHNVRKCPSCGFTRKEKIMIDWTNPDEKITEHFTVKEALYLPSWGRLATIDDGLTDEIKNNLITLCGILEKIRSILNCPMNIHNMFRPPEYSIEIGGSATDPHTRGMAADWDNNPDMTCDEAKQLLIPRLEEMNIRLEDNGLNASWNHADFCPVKFKRFFKP